MKKICFISKVMFALIFMIITLLPIFADNQQVENGISNTNRSENSLNEIAEDINSNTIGDNIIDEFLIYTVKDEDAMTASVMMSEDLRLSVVTIKPTITINGKTYSVTSLEQRENGKAAFEDNSYISTIVLPESIKEIPDKAFQNCININTISLSCDASIGDNAFTGCNTLYTVKVLGGNISDPLTVELRKIETQTNHLDKIYWWNRYVNVQTQILIDFTKNGGSKSQAFYLNTNGTATLYINQKSLGVNLYIPIKINYQNVEYKVTTIDWDIPEMYLGQPKDFIIEEGHPYFLKKDNMLVEEGGKVLKWFDQKASETEVTIPEGIEVIGDRVFKSRGLEKVNFPSTLKKIGESAFEYNNLQDISFPDSVEEIGERAFYNCKIKTDLKLPNNLRTLQDSSFFGNQIETLIIPLQLTRIENGAISAKYVVIPSTVKYIGASNFCGDKANDFYLESVTIEEGVETIGAGSFCFTNLEIVSIPASVTFIGEKAFICNNNLKSIIVDEKNLNYVSVDGMLYNKELTTLMAYPLGNINYEVKVLDSTNRINKNVFEGWQYNGELTLKVKEVGLNGFIRSKVKRVKFEKPLKILGSYAFVECKDIECLEIPSTMQVGEYRATGAGDSIKLVENGITLHIYDDTNIKANNSWSSKNGDGYFNDSYAAIKNITGEPGLKITNTSSLTFSIHDPYSHSSSSTLSPGESYTFGTGYTIQYFYQNEDGTWPDNYSEAESFQANAGNNINAVAKKVDNYRFDTNIDKNILSGKVPSTGALILKLYYRKQVNVNFETNTDMKLKTQVVDLGTQINEPIGLEKTGYKMTGWYSDSMFTKSWDFSKENIEKDITLYAKWEIATYTATFDRNDGKNLAPTLITKTYQKELGTLPIASRNGYIFEGWYTEKIGGDKINEKTKMPANGATYYAHWKTIDYTITYNFNGNGAFLPIDNDNPLSYTIESETFTLHNPMRNGYVFKGWKDEKNNVQMQVVITKGTTGDKTYTGIWEQHISKDDNCINGIKNNDTYTIGDKIAFTAIGSGMDNQNPVIGDKRYLPIRWNVNPQGIFDENESYQVTFDSSSMKVGKHTLHVIFELQEYTDKGWTSLKIEDDKTVSFMLNEKIEISVDNKNQSLKDNASHKEENVKTDDISHLTLWITMVIVSTGILGFVMLGYQSLKNK